MFNNNHFAGDPNDLTIDTNKPNCVRHTDRSVNGHEQPIDTSGREIDYLSCITINVRKCN